VKQRVSWRYARAQIGAVAPKKKNIHIHVLKFLLGNSKLET
jgi:hypothetical protein